MIKKIVFALLSVCALSLFALPAFTSGQQKKGEVKVTKGNKDSGGGSGQSQFYGIGFDFGKHNVLFILDNSSSMGGERLSTLKAEFQQMMNKTSASKRPRYDDEEEEADYTLMKKGKFMVSVYNSSHQEIPNNGTFKFSDSLRKRQTVDIINKISACGSTSMMRVWKDLESAIAKNGIDVVFFLTDGDPTDCSHDQLIQYLESTYSGKDIRINCISIGNESELLEKIAKKFHGTYKRH